MFIRVGHHIKGRREAPALFAGAIDRRVVAWVIVIVANHGVEYHAIEQLKQVLRRRADAFQFFC